MGELSQNIKEAILGRAYPELLYDSDPDIEKYFELRSQGRSSEALLLYTQSLTPKYPDREKRVLLMRLYRSRDPLYASFLKRCAMDLALTIAERIKRNIRYLSWPVEGVNLKDAFRLIKAVEEVVKFLPSDKYEAASLLDDYAKYAVLLDFKAPLMAKTAEIVKEYLLESGTEEGLQEIDFIENSRKREEADRAKRKSQYFDLSRISFSAADEARILLPPRISRKEDQVLAFCYRYWNLVQDSGFERIVLLYSRKYGTKHYDIFRAIKIGRSRKFTDDEILNTVSTIMSSSYSYSVQGDIYMQTMWRRLKKGLVQGAPVRAEAPAQPPAAPPAGRRSAAPKAAPKASKAAGGEKPPAPPVARGLPAAQAGKAPAAPAARAAAQGPAPSVHAGVAAPSKPAPKPAAPKRSAVSPAPAAAAKPAARRGKARAAVAQEQVGESVSDIIKRLSGRTYDVYRDMFLEKVGPSIRAYLTDNRTHKRLIFDTSLNASEEIVLSFLKANYENPYMDWEGSDERKRVEGLGYEVGDLAPIIEDCYRKL